MKWSGQRYQIPTSLLSSEWVGSTIILDLSRHLLPWWSSSTFSEEEFQGCARHTTGSLQASAQVPRLYFLGVRRHSLGRLSVG